MHRYTFRALTDADLPTIAQWLRTPEAVRWWGDPGEQLALVGEDLFNDAMHQWIVCCDGEAFAYAQAYEVHAWPQPHLTHLPPGAMAIDTFIGLSNMVARGRGRLYLGRLRARVVRHGAPAVAP